MFFQSANYFLPKQQVCSQCSLLQYCIVVGIVHNAVVLPRKKALKRLNKERIKVYFLWNLFNSQQLFAGGKNKIKKFVFFFSYMECYCRYVNYKSLGFFKLAKRCWANITYIDYIFDNITVDYIFSNICNIGRLFDSTLWYLHFASIAHMLAKTISVFLTGCQYLCNIGVSHCKANISVILAFHCRYFHCKVIISVIVVFHYKYF